MTSETVYVMPDAGEVVFPGDPCHALLDATLGLSESEQRKMLHLLNLMDAGEFDIMQTLAWPEQQKREFMAALPEA